MVQAKLVLIPLATTPTLTLKSGMALSDLTEFRAVVRSLQYVSPTHHDIVFAVNKLSQFMHHPTTEHWNAVKHILRYLLWNL